MAQLWAMKIRLGMATIEDVPDRHREQVELLLAN